MLNILCNYDSFLVTFNVNPCGLLIVTCNKAGLPRESTEEDTEINMPLSNQNIPLLMS